MSVKGVVYKATAAVLFVLSAALTASCGSSMVTVAARPTPVPSAVQDCRGATETDPSYAAALGVEFHTLQVDGKLRDYRVFRPSTVDITKPVPLVVVLHGSPADAQSFEDLIHFDAEAVAGKFMTAGPNGCAGYWSYAERGPYQADEDFIRQMISDLEATYRIDRSRIYVVGASAGSWVAYRLACDLADEIAAIVSIAGTMRLSDSCEPVKPVSVLEMHGTLDTVHPWQGGGPHLASPVESVIHRWVALDGCTVGPVFSKTGITTTSTWSHCAGAVQVRLDAVVGGLHQWFGSDFSPVPGEPNANSTIWNFFGSVPPRT
jgi:polyhydroxybutyrate depolymerase